MRIQLRQTAANDATITLEGTIPASEVQQALRYKTRVGTVAQLDGETIGAFDREHTEIVIDAAAQARTLTLEVERHSLPTHGLPSGPGFKWWLINALSHPNPAMNAGLVERSGRLREPDSRSASDAVVLWGHSHLDVAWLWTYEQTQRKAQRTFAIALDLLERDPSFVFMQSQPQLYAFVKARDPELFEWVRAHVKTRRFDPDVAALWVESDCNLPSGESLIRQMLHAKEFCEKDFGVTPSIAWLPDTFGFANTLPTLLAHCGITRFATTKLRWNDTTQFPYPQFVWRGPDGGEVIGALIASYDGGPEPNRVATARERHEPLVAGYGDGGGGVTPEMLAQARDLGQWERPSHWFASIEARRAQLPVHRDELYLEYHRGVYTTHHDLKESNASLERRLGAAEEALAWCTAVRAPRGTIDQLRDHVHAVWEIVLRNQFHDVLPGTSIEPAMSDSLSEYLQAQQLVDRVLSATQAMLPRASGTSLARPLRAPRESGGDFIFDNSFVHLRVRPNGTIVDCTCRGANNVVAQGNVLATYQDVPKQWEAWNIDAGYQSTQTSAKPGKASIIDDTLAIPFEIGSSRATMHISLHEGEPFVRVTLAVNWQERKRLLRVENWLAIDADIVTYGSPHGVIERSARADTPAEQAKYEVPGQRFASVQGSTGGLALLTLDTYGWSGRALENGGVRVGHSLLRGTTWPDPQADVGEHVLSWAYLPIPPTAAISEIEGAWEMFAQHPRVRLFTTQSPGTMVVACKPAQDGDGVIVRVRECNGRDAQLKLRCGGRMHEVFACDGLERPLEKNDARIAEESLLSTIRAYGLRTFRVRF